MPNVTIRDVPPEVHAVLAARAAAEGKSLQRYLHGLLVDEAHTPTTAEWVAEAERELEAEERELGGPRGRRPIDVVAIVHAGRAERDADLACR